MTPPDNPPEPGPPAQPPAPSMPPAPMYPPQGQYPPQPPYGAVPYGVAPRSNGIAVAGGVIGIVAVVLMWIPFIDFFAIVLGVLAVIFGFIGLQRANAMGGTSKGMAITGIVCGIIAAAVSILFIVAVYSALLHFGTYSTSFGT